MEPCKQMCFLVYNLRFILAASMHASRASEGPQEWSGYT